MGRYRPRAGTGAATDRRAEGAAQAKAGKASGGLILITVAAGLLVSGCAGQGPGTTAAAIVELPPNYREIVTDHVRKTFVDPYSIRDAEIAPPKMAMGPSLNNDGSFYTPWVVCIRANAKNRMGGYTGAQVTAIALNGAKVVNSWDEAHYSGMVCRGLAYEPFPEIEQGGQRPAATPPAKSKR